MDLMNKHYVPEGIEKSPDRQDTAANIAPVGTVTGETGTVRVKHGNIRPFTGMIYHGWMYDNKTRRVLFSYRFICRTRPNKENIAEILKFESQ
jgi:hypothetical protein